MKKIIFGCIIFCFFAVQVAAQTPTFVKGDNVINLGIGFGGTWYSGYGFGWSAVTRTPTFSVSYEHCIIDNLWDEKSSIGVGGLLGYSSIKWKDSNWKINNTFIGVRGALHYSFVNKLDTYAGLMMGYKIVSDNSDWNYGNTFSSDLFAGARYYLSNNFAVFSEVGYWTFFNIGISIKF